MTEFLRRLQTQILDRIVRMGASRELENRAEFFVSRVERFLPANSRVLDIGGRWGFYAAPLERRGHRPCLIDVVRPGYQRAPVIVYDGERMPFPDGSFDCSLLVTVLHHIGDQAKVLREALRVTRGRIIVVEDLYHHGPGRFWTILRDRIYNFEWVGHPCNFRTRAGWDDYFEKLGLRVVSFEEMKTQLCGLSILNGVFVLERNS